MWTAATDRIKADKGLPKMFERYNGKPTLMTKSSRIVQGPGYFEMDVSVSIFLTQFTRQADISHVEGTVSQRTHVPVLSMCLVTTV
eukprot:COSAG02_NODE_345_length_24135_cov_6.425404_13_plen_86_part_00